MKSACLAVVFAASLVCSSYALAQSDNDIVKVEEDWVLVVGESHEPSTSPQVTITVFPYESSESEYAQFLLNFQNSNGFIPGGMEMVLVESDHVTDASSFSSSEALESTNETIRWTMRMELKEGELRVSVVNGSSDTWGSFGGQGLLKVRKSTVRSDLNHYSAWQSWDNSGASFGANRVTSLRMLGGRKYKRDGQVSSWTVSE